jgi:hypothetical protein
LSEPIGRGGSPWSPARHAAERRKILAIVGGGRRCAPAAPNSRSNRSTKVGCLILAHPHLFEFAVIIERDAGVELSAGVLVDACSDIERRNLV